MDLSQISLQAIALWSIFIDPPRLDHIWGWRRRIRALAGAWACEAVMAATSLMNMWVGMASKFWSVCLDDIHIGRNLTQVQTRSKNILSMCLLHVHNVYLEIHGGIRMLRSTVPHCFFPLIQIFGKWPIEVNTIWITLSTTLSFWGNLVMSEPAPCECVWWTTLCMLSNN